VPRTSLPLLARGATALAGLVGTYGVLHLFGAFGPISCWESRSVSGSASTNGTVTTTTPTVTRGCKSGIDVLLGTGGPPGGGNAATLFAWAAVLAVLVAVGCWAAWTDRRRIAWASVVVGAAVTVVGVFSIGWVFLGPTLGLFVATTARSVAARRAA
jgi:hypothetical protein